MVDAGALRRYLISICIVTEYDDRLHVIIDGEDVNIVDDDDDDDDDNINYNNSPTSLLTLVPERSRDVSPWYYNYISRMIMTIIIYYLPFMLLNYHYHCCCFCFHFEKTSRNYFSSFLSTRCVPSG